MDLPPELDQWVTTKKFAGVPIERAADFEGGELQIRITEHYQGLFDFSDAPVPIVITSIPQSQIPHPPLRLRPSARHSLTVTQMSSGQHRLDLGTSAFQEMRFKGRENCNGVFVIEAAPEGCRLIVEGGQVKLESVGPSVTAAGGRITVGNGGASLLLSPNSTVCIDGAGHLNSLTLDAGSTGVIGGGDLTINELLVDESTLQAAEGASIKVSVLRLGSGTQRSLSISKDLEVEVFESARSLKISGQGTLSLHKMNREWPVAIKNIVERDLDLEDLTITLTGRLEIGPAVTLSEVTGYCHVVSLFEHSRLVVANGSRWHMGFMVYAFDQVHETSTVHDIHLTRETSASMLEQLQHAQDVSIPIGGLGLNFDALPRSSEWHEYFFMDASKRERLGNLNVDTARKVERAVDAGARLAQMRCGSGARRAEWHIRQLEVRHARSSGLDRFLYAVRIRCGDAINVQRCFLCWLTAAIVSTPVMVRALGANPLHVHLLRWRSWQIFGRALSLVLFSVFHLVAIGGTDGTGIRPLPAWTLPIKLVMTLLLASFISSLVRRVRWTPSDPPTR